MPISREYGDEWMFIKTTPDDGDKLIDVALRPYSRRKFNTTFYYFMQSSCGAAVPGAAAPAAPAPAAAAAAGGILQSFRSCAMRQSLSVI